MLFAQIIITVLLLKCIEFIEFWLEVNWNKRIFTKGYKLFRKTYEFSKAPTVDELEIEYITDASAPMIFKEYNQTEIAFRYTHQPFHFVGGAPVMRGLICIDHSSKTIQINGYARWTTILCPFGYIYIALVIALKLEILFLILLVLIPLGFIWISYDIQKDIFAEVGEFISTKK